MRMSLRKVLSLVLSMVLVLSLAACGEESGGVLNIGGDKGESVNLTETVQLSATPLAPGTLCCTVGEYEKIQALAIDIFKNANLMSDDENMLVSPVSVIMALAMTAQGAEAETLEQFEEFFDTDVNFFAQLMDGYTKEITEGNETAKVNVANSVWLRDDPERLNVKEDFLALCNNFGAEVFKSPFNKVTLRDVNKWVEKNTDGMIDKILEEVKEEHVLYLINALTFDNQWEHKYEGNDINDWRFITADGREQKAEFMHSSEEVYLEDDKAAGFIKPYKDGFSFVAILPNEGVSVDEYIAGMDGDTLAGLIEGGRDEQWIRAGMPKFKNEMSMSMVEVLENMGLTEMFGAESADFKAMAESSRGNIFISEVLHKTFIEVDSEGTRAAAATIVEATEGAAAVEPKYVILDRPFIYMIVDDTENIPLFIGTVESLG